MKTLIELYDTSPIENVLGTLVFQPEETIFLCPPEAANDHMLKQAARDFLAYLKCPTRLKYVPVSLLDADKTERVLREVLDSHRDCAIDISGGTDASLFATGRASGDVPVFTYSVRNHAFFEICNAAFARGLPCDVHLDVAACLLLTGGKLLPGREDNSVLEGMTDRIDRLFAVYSKFRHVWNWQISYIQKISSSAPGSLWAEGNLTEDAGNKHVDADPGLFDALAGAGLILDLQYSTERIRFRFPDETVRFWLRDIGSVLELQVWRACRAAGCFDDVVLSAVVNWQNEQITTDSVTNEIDVMAVKGIQPVFISCKTSDVHTEALNELSILRSRFGGKFSRAILATSGMASESRAPMRSRAAKLGIELIEWEDMSLDRLVNRLRQEG